MNFARHFCAGVQTSACLILATVLAATVAQAGDSPTITNANEPADAGVLLGQSPVFSVAVSSATPVSYQWFFNDQPLAGQTNQSLTLVGAVTNESGFYSVVITNASGSVTSRLATVTVVEPGYGAKAVINLGNLTAYRSQTGLVVNVTTTGDAVGGNIFGTDRYTDDSYLPKAVVHVGVLTNGESGTVSILVMPDAGSYTSTTRNGVTSSSYGAWVGSYEILARVPTFSSQPISQAVLDGSPVSFTCAAVFPNPFTFQWLRNGVVMPGETNATLNLPSASPSVSGSYAVQGRTAAGTNTSEIAQLVVLPGNPGDPAIPDPGSISSLAGVAGTVYHITMVGNTNGGNVWGTGIYTSDSQISRAAVHAGFLAPGQTGIVAVVVLPGQPFYFASLRNGVQSLVYPAWPRAYGFVGSAVAFQPVCTNLTVTLSAMTTNCTTSNNIVGWWKADGDMLDASGNNNHGSTPNSVNYVTGAAGQAFQLGLYDSDLDQLVFSNYHRVDLGALPQLYSASGFTMAGWIRLPHLGAHQIFSFPASIPGSHSTNAPYNSVTSSFGCQADVGLAVNFSMGLDNGVVVTNNFSGNTAYFTSTNQWLHLAFTWNSADGIVYTYTNGIPAQTTPNPVSVGRTLATLAQRSHQGVPIPAVLGEGVQLYSEPDAPIWRSQNNFETHVDEFQLYNRALSSSEIMFVYSGDSTVTNIATTSCVASPMTTNLDFCPTPKGKLQIFNAAPNHVQLFWPSQINAFYLLQGSDEVSPLNWTTVWGAQAGNGSNVIVPDPTTSRPHRFYRLLSTEQ